MADPAFIKKAPDGRMVVVADLTATEARVRIGEEYRIMPIEVWRALPIWDGPLPATLAAR